MSLGRLTTATVTQWRTIVGLSYGKFAALVAALVVSIAALTSSVSAQPIVHVLKAHTVAPIRGTVVWAAYGTKVSVMDARTQQVVATIDFLDTVFDLSRSGEFVAVTLPHGVEIWEIGHDGEMAGNPKLAGSVAGKFVSATIAGEFVVGIDADDNIQVIRWRKGEVPTQPCPFKGGCPNKDNAIFLPIVHRSVCDGRGPEGPDYPCGTPVPAGPTMEPGEDPTPPHGPTIPPAPLDPTPVACGYPPCNAAELFDR